MTDNTTPNVNPPFSAALRWIQDRHICSKQRELCCVPDNAAVCLQHSSCKADSAVWPYPLQVAGQTTRVTSLQSASSCPLPAAFQVKTHAADAAFKSLLLLYLPFSSSSMQVSALFELCSTRELAQASARADSIWLLVCLTDCEVQSCAMLFFLSF